MQPFLTFSPSPEAHGIEAERVVSSPAILPRLQCIANTIPPSHHHHPAITSTSSRRSLDPRRTPPFDMDVAGLHNLQRERSLNRG